MQPHSYLIWHSFRSKVGKINIKQAWRTRGLYPLCWSIAFVKHFLIIFSMILCEYAKDLGSYCMWNNLVDTLAWSLRYQDSITTEGSQWFSFAEEGEIKVSSNRNEKETLSTKSYRRDCWTYCTKQITAGTTTRSWKIEELKITAGTTTRSWKVEELQQRWWFNVWQKKEKSQRTNHLSRCLNCLYFRSLR